MKKNLHEKLVMPEGVSASFKVGTLVVKGPKGELNKSFKDPNMQIKVEGNTVVLTAENATRRVKCNLFTTKALIKNMISGVTEPHSYKLKICAGHFPMNVAMQGKVFTIKNFLGEKFPRTYTVPESVDVKIDGTDVIVTSIDVGLAGQTAASLEQLTRITNRDLRIFQDGLYIVEKRGKKI